VKNYGFETASTAAATPVPGWTTSGAVGGLTEVGTENEVTPIQGTRQLRSVATGTGYNTISQTVTLCPGQTSLTLTVWAREYIPMAGGCSVRVCIGSICSTTATSSTYSAYRVTANNLSGSPVISAGLSCGMTTLSGTRGYIDFVTIG
jgi:hypothetical protein